MTADRRPEPPTIAIVGGGAAGALVAIHLLRRTTRPVRVVLFDERGSRGRGIAYAADSHAFRLNVPASRLGTGAAAPSEFFDWLRDHGADPEREPFATRASYGAFLEAQLDLAADAARRVGAVLACRTAGIRGITNLGDREELRLADGTVVHADFVVLAIGPPTAAADPLLLPDSEQSFASPWERGALDPPSPGSAVLLRGAGLTAIDAALALLQAEPDLQVTFVSRTGVLPQVHAETDTAPSPRIDEPSWLTDRSGLTWDELRRRAIEHSRMHVDRGGDERELVDGVRPHVTSLWQRLGVEEQRRFLEHDLRAWDVRRHRMAPAVAVRVGQLLERGALVHEVGTIAAVRQVADGYAVDLRGTVDHQLVVQRLIDCVGFGRTDRRVAGSLLDAVVVHGRAVPDAHGLGIRTDGSGRVIDAGGVMQERLAVIGALRRGELWESTAIPEIRAQAEQLADDLVRSLLPPMED